MALVIWDKKREHGMEHENSLDAQPWSDGTRLELVKRPATIRYLDHSGTAAAQPRRIITIPMAHVLGALAYRDFPEVINSIVVKIPSPTDISLLWVPF
ncbi:hypothetical protein TNCV_4543901 [Trichonephila clavipes]|nr:hypothetical protein TNCV_4543901 [Trichonephila clavipes]